MFHPFHGMYVFRWVTEKHKGKITQFKNRVAIRIHIKDSDANIKRQTT